MVRSYAVPAGPSTPSVPMRGNAIGEALRTGVGWAVLLLVGLLLGRAPLVWCLAVLLMLGGALAMLCRPAVALYALAFAVPFGSLVAGRIAGASVGPLDVLTFALLGVWLLRVAAQRRWPHLRSSLTLALLGFLAALLVAAYRAASPGPALKEAAKWIEFSIVFAFVRSEARDRDLRGLVLALLVAATIEGLVGIYQFLFRLGPAGFVLSGRYMRAYGTFGQPNPFGAYVGLLLPLAYSTLLAVNPVRVMSGTSHHLEGKGQAWQRTSGILTWAIAAIATVVLLAALLMSASRGALLGLVGGAVCVVLALGRRVWLILAVICIVVLVAGPTLGGMLPDSLVSRVTDSFQYVGARDLSLVEINDDNYSVIERAAHWVAAWRLFERNPWLGVGLGQYALEYPDVALPRWQDPLGHAHNYYLQLLSEGGLTSLAGYGLLLTVALVCGFRSASRERGWRRGLALATLGMLGHLSAHSLFDNLYVHGMYLIVAMLVGAVTAMSDRAAANDNLAPAPE